MVVVLATLNDTPYVTLVALTADDDNETKRLVICPAFTVPTFINAGKMLAEPSATALTNATLRRKNVLIFISFFLLLYLLFFIFLAYTSVYTIT